MISRFMRVMVFFDLPTITDKNRHDYRKFRQFLVSGGIYYDAGICVYKACSEWNYG